MLVSLRRVYGQRWHENDYQFEASDTVDDVRYLCYVDNTDGETRKSIVLETLYAAQVQDSGYCHWRRDQCYRLEDNKDADASVSVTSKKQAAMTVPASFWQHELWCWCQYHVPIEDVYNSIRAVLSIWNCTLVSVSRQF